jgi:subtilisin-like proprotein convertase family protein
MPNRVVGHVAIDPNNSSTAYATFGGFGVPAGQHVWKTLNLAGGATTWVAAGTGLPDVPTNAFVIDPRNSNNLYAGTDIGVYSSIDGGNSWQPYGTGLPRVAVFGLDIQSTARVLRAATHGRGMWEIAIDGTPSGLLAITNVSIIPGPGGNGNAFIEPGERGQITVQVANNGTAGATGISVTVTSLNSNVALTTATASIADLAPGANGVTSVPLTFEVPSTTPCGAGAKLTISVNWNGATLPRIKSVTVGLGAPASTSSTFTYSGPPAAIPDNNIATGVTVPLTVSGISGSVSSVKLVIDGSSCNATAGSTTVGINHTYVGDLSITLISPSGTAVQLTPINGNVAGVNFCGTTFDDNASTAWTAATTAQNPYTGSFRPFVPLSTFLGETANGTWQLKVVDGGPADTGSVRAFSIVVTGSSCAAPCPALSVSPATLPNASAGTPYSQTLTAAGGVGPYSFATASPLPLGITLSSSGLLSGTTTQTGSFPISATATDFYGCSVTVNSTLVLSCPTITVAPSTLPAPEVGVLYSQTITASGGAGTTTFASTGTLPPGLTLNAASGVLSGTPTTAGPFPFSVTATDASGCTGSTSYSVVVNKSNPLVTWANPADITYGTALSATQFNATANVGGSFAYSAATGTVLAAGSAQSLSVTFTPTDAANYNNATRAVVINVLRAALTIAADSKSKVYGTANPLLTVSFSGFVNGDTPASLTGTLSATTSAVQTSGAGTYPILVGGVSSPTNYTIAFVPNVLTVTKAPLTVRADDKSNYYGDPVPALTASYTGFVLTDVAATSLTGRPLLSTAATPSSPAGTYAITISAATLASANYAFTFVNGTLTIDGPQDAIRRAKADLTTLRASSTVKQTNDRLDRAIGDLAGALDAKRWLDTSHLPSAEGSTVFQQAKGAVTELTAIIADKNPGISTVEVQASVNRIVGAVRGLAVIAVGSVNSDIQAGDALIAQSKYEAGIEKYRVTWQAAMPK